MDELEQLQAALDAIPDAMGAEESSGEGDATDRMHAAMGYRVQPNDTLVSIAAAYDTTPDALLAANVGSLINDNLLVGQFIRVPSQQAES